MDQPTVIALISKHLSGNISGDEEQELMQWFKTVEEEEFSEVMNAAKPQLPGEYAATFAVPPDFAQRLEQRIDELEAEEQESSIHDIKPVHRIHFLRTAWFKYAAAVIIMFGVGAYLYISNQKEKPSVTQTNPVPVQNDVAPGGNRATLTLADGSKIVLDSAANGTLAQEGTSTIQKIGEEIIYNKKIIPSQREGSGVGSTAYAMNKVTTPRGGQYRITLEDGTQVWLNAESSITYPTAFTEKERKVSITGEAYFEVAKDRTKPFKVLVQSNAAAEISLKKEKNIPSLREGSGVGSENEQGSKNDLEIEVLGTHFNINSYNEEKTKNITLLEGSVRLTAHDSRLTNVHTSLTLKPGQQGQLLGNRLSLAVKPDLEQVMAWKNGLFNFNNKTLEESLRQLARWYDVDVEFEGKTPPIKLAGTIGRSLTLQQVLKGLSAMELKTRLDASKKKLVILE